MGDRDLKPQNSNKWQQLASKSIDSKGFVFFNYC